MPSEDRRFEEHAARIDKLLGPSKDELSNARTREEWEQDRTSAALNARIAALEAERDRLAQELAESQIEQTGLRWALNDLLHTLSLGPLEAAALYGPDVDLDGLLDAATDRAQLALAHPSPAAQAIGRVLESVSQLHTHVYGPVGCSLRHSDYSLEVAELFDAHEALQALRAGAGEGKS